MKKKDELPFELSYESDGQMGDEKKKGNHEDEPPIEFFNITQESE